MNKRLVKDLVKERERRRQEIVVEISALETERTLANRAGKGAITKKLKTLQKEYDELKE